MNSYVCKYDESLLKTCRLFAYDMLLAEVLFKIPVISIVSELYALLLTDMTGIMITLKMHK